MKIKRVRKKRETNGDRFMYIVYVSVYLSSFLVIEEIKKRERREKEFCNVQIKVTTHTHYRME